MPDSDSSLCTHIFRRVPFNSSFATLIVSGDVGGRWVCFHAVTYGDEGRLVEKDRQADRDRDRETERERQTERDTE